MESVWSVFKLTPETVGSRHELVANCVQTSDADATKQFRRVGGVYWALSYRLYTIVLQGRRHDDAVPEELRHVTVSTNLECEYQCPHSFYRPMNNRQARTRHAPGTCVSSYCLGIWKCDGYIGFKQCCGLPGVIVVVVVIAGRAVVGSAVVVRS